MSACMRKGNIFRPSEWEEEEEEQEQAVVRPRLNERFRNFAVASASSSAAAWERSSRVTALTSSVVMVLMAGVVLVWWPSLAQGAAGAAAVSLRDSRATTKC